jgi:YaiO family outer membrane protein
MSSPESSASRLFLSRPFFLVLLTLVPWYLSTGQNATSIDSLNATLFRARTFSQEKDYERAGARYREYLLVKPTDDDVRNELARMYSWDSKFDSALVQYDIVIHHDRNNFDAHFGKCQVMAWKHDFQEALKELETLVILSPQNIDVFLLAGKVHAWNGDFAHSLGMYQKVLILDGLNEEGLVGKSRALEGLGKRDEAYSEIADARKRLPHSMIIERLYAELAPRPRNQVYASFQEQNFNVQDRSDHRTFTVQYYRTMRTDLTLYAELDQYRRFDQNDQSLGIGTYWTITERQSLFAYCLVSPDPRVTSTVDCSVELTQRITDPLNVFLAYRLLDFKTETAHIVSPGFSFGIIGGVSIKPRFYVSRTVITKTTSVAYALQMTLEALGSIRPFLYYAVGNEAYRGVTLDNVESSESWSVTIGGSYVFSRKFTLTVAYEYLNRIGFFRSNAFTIGGGYYW